MKHFFFSVLNEILSHLIWHRSLYANARSEFVAYHYGASEWNSLTPRKFNYPGLKAAVSCSPIFQRITQLSYQYVPKKTIKYAVGTFVTSGAHVSTQTTCAELVVIPMYLAENTHERSGQLRARMAQLTVFCAWVSRQGVRIFPVRLCCKTCEAKLCAPPSDGKERARTGTIGCIVAWTIPNMYTAHSK